MKNLKDLNPQDRLYIQLFGIENGEYAEDINEVDADTIQFRNETVPEIIEDLCDENRNFTRYHYIGSYAIKRCYTRIKNLKQRLKNLDELDNVGAKLIKRELEKELHFFKDTLKKIVEYLDE